MHHDADDNHRVNVSILYSKTTNLIFRNYVIGTRLRNFRVGSIHSVLFDVVDESCSTLKIHAGRKVVRLFKIYRLLSVVARGIENHNRDGK